MNPWMTEQLAEARRRDLLSTPSPRHWAPGARAANGGRWRARMGRPLGELLMRAGRRLMGPDSAPPTVVSRLVLRGAPPVGAQGRR
jgi:hypothetical protein